MESSSSGVAHVEHERTIVHAEGNEHYLLTENVLIEIGAAMAFWGDNFILLVEEGTKLPSNRQGLHEVRYSGASLDHDATLKLLRAFKEFRSCESRIEAGDHTSVLLSLDRPSARPGRRLVDGSIRPIDANGLENAPIPLPERVRG